MEGTYEETTEIGDKDAIKNPKQQSEFRLLFRILNGMVWRISVVYAE